MVNYELNTPSCSENSGKVCKSFIFSEAYFCKLLKKLDAKKFYVGWAKSFSCPPTSLGPASGGYASL